MRHRKYLFATAAAVLSGIMTFDFALCAEEEQETVETLADTGITYGSIGIGFLWLLLIPVVVGLITFLYGRIKSKNEASGKKDNLRFTLKMLGISAAICCAAAVILTAADTVKYYSYDVVEVTRSEKNETVAEETEIPEIQLKETLRVFDFESEEDTLASGERVPFAVAERGGTYGWKIDGVFEATYLGESSWTDYSVQVDILFEENSAQANGSVFELRGRVIQNKLYRDNRYYSAQLKNGNELVLYYKNAGGCGFDQTLKTVKLESYADGKVHNLRMDFLDNNIIIYWDGESLIECTHNYGNSPLNGKVMLSATNTSLTVDNLTVTKIYDAVGGSDDNSMAGNFNGENEVSSK